MTPVACWYKIGFGENREWKRGSILGFVGHQKPSAIVSDDKSKRLAMASIDDISTSTQHPDSYYDPVSMIYFPSHSHFLRWCEDNRWTREAEKAEEAESARKVAEMLETSAR